MRRLSTLHNIIIIKLNEPGVRLSLVLNFQLNSVLAERTDLVDITINIHIIHVVVVVVIIVIIITGQRLSSKSALSS